MYSYDPSLIHPMSSPNTIQIRIHTKSYKYTKLGGKRLFEDESGQHCQPPPKKWMVSYIVIPKVPKSEHFVGANRYCTPIATTRRWETLCRTFWRRAATSRTSWSNKSESEATRSVKLVRLFPQETKIKEVSPNFRTSEPQPPPIFQESLICWTPTDSALEDWPSNVWGVPTLTHTQSMISYILVFAAAWIISVSPWGLEEPPKHSPHREASGKSWWLPSVKIMSTLVGIKTAKNLWLPKLPTCNAATSGSPRNAEMG